jgi:hypothetical protein
MMGPLVSTQELTSPHPGARFDAVGAQALPESTFRNYHPPMKHLRILKLLNRVYAALVFLTCLGVVAAVAIPTFAGGRMGIGLAELSILGGVFVIAVILGVLYLATGKLVAEGRGRILQTVMAVLSLGSAPVGTAYGVYALWVCWMNEETKALFR